MPDALLPRDNTVTNSIIRDFAALYSVNDARYVLGDTGIAWLFRRAAPPGHAWIHAILEPDSVHLPLTGTDTTVMRGLTLDIVWLRLTTTHDSESWGIPIGPEWLTLASSRADSPLTNLRRFSANCAVTYAAQHSSSGSRGRRRSSFRRHSRTQPFSKAAERSSGPETRSAVGESGRDTEQQGSAGLSTASGSAATDSERPQLVPLTLQSFASVQEALRGAHGSCSLLWSKVLEAITAEMAPSPCVLVSHFEPTTPALTVAAHAKGAFLYALSATQQLQVRERHRSVAMVVS